MSKVQEANLRTLESGTRFSIRSVPGTKKCLPKTIDRFEAKGTSA
ncbi:hypothetical protein LJR104_004747 [Neorhizobium sp. LjRoot104]